MLIGQLSVLEACSSFWAQLASLSFQPPGSLDTLCTFPRSGCCLCCSVIVQVFENSSEFLFQGFFPQAKVHQDPKVTLFSGLYHCITPNLRVLPNLWMSLLNCSNQDGQVSRTLLSGAEQRRNTTSLDVMILINVL